MIGIPKGTLWGGKLGLPSLVIGRLFKSMHDKEPIFTNTALVHSNCLSLSKEKP